MIKKLCVAFTSSSLELVGGNFFHSRLLSQRKKKKWRM